jgi:hypothetical protein
MAQDASTKLPVIAIASPADRDVSQDQPAKIDTLPTTLSPQPPVDQNDQLGKDPSQLKPEPGASDDDEVQFVFSAPRRRKRKRKRYKLL